MMGIIDPALIALLRNFCPATKPGCLPADAIGAVLVDSLCRSAMTAPARS